MKTPTPFASLLAIALLVSLVGCKQKTVTSTTNSPTATGDHDHEHPDQESRDDHSVAGHGHGIGPHNGVIADWGGGKFHVEFTVDHDKTQATAYVLGNDEKTATPIDAENIEMAIVDPEILVTLKASPQESDPVGQSSRFIGTHEKLGVVQEYEGTMTGLVEGTPYSGDFKEEAHDH